MKKPCIKDIDRWCAIKFPDSFHAFSINFAIAFARLKREIYRAILNDIQKIIPIKK